MQDRDMNHIETLIAFQHASMAVTFERVVTALTMYITMTSAILSNDYTQIDKSTAIERRIDRITFTNTKTNDSFTYEYHHVGHSEPTFPEVIQALKDEMEDLHGFHFENDYDHWFNAMIDDYGIGMAERYNVYSERVTSLANYRRIIGLYEMITVFFGRDVPELLAYCEMNEED